MGDEQGVETMAVYVDPIVKYTDAQFSNIAAKRYGYLWCHMTADSVEELHKMAQLLGLKRSWFQSKSVLHYDLTPAMRSKAVANGAIEITPEERSAVFKKRLIQGREYREMIKVNRGKTDDGIG